MPVSESDALAEDAGSALSDMNNLLDKEDEGKTEVVDTDVDDLVSPDDKEDKGEEEEVDEKAETEDEDEDDYADEDELDEAAELQASGEPQIIKDIEKKYPKLFKEFKSFFNRHIKNI